MANNGERELVGQVMKLVQTYNPNIIDLVEVLQLAHGMVRLCFLERSRKPVIWIPISGILELRETGEQTG